MMVWRLVLLIASLLLSILAGLIALAARSDFVMRGCPEIPRDAWPATVNCSDGSMGQWIFGMVSIGCLCLFGALIVRGGRA